MQIILQNHGQKCKVTVQFLQNLKHSEWGKTVMYSRNKITWMIFSVFTVHKIQFSLNLHSVRFSHHATSSKYSHMSLLSSSTFLKGHTQYTYVCYVLKIDVNLPMRHQMRGIIWFLKWFLNFTALNKVPKGKETRETWGEWLGDMLHFPQNPDKRKSYTDFSICH